MIIDLNLDIKLGLWALLFIMYLGVIWLTLSYRLQRIERLLMTLRKTNTNLANIASVHSGKEKKL